MTPNQAEIHIALLAQQPWFAEHLTAHGYAQTSPTTFTDGKGAVQIDGLRLSSIRASALPPGARRSQTRTPRSSSSFSNLSLDLMHHQGGSGMVRGGFGKSCRKVLTMNLRSKSSTKRSSSCLTLGFLARRHAHTENLPIFLHPLPRCGGKLSPVAKG